jgi:hypothetical protein
MPAFKARFARKLGDHPSLVFVMAAVFTAFLGDLETRAIWHTDCN